MICQRIGFPPISIIGLGRVSVSSVNRVPSPPARMTTFIRTFAAVPRLFERMIGNLRGQRQELMVIGIVPMIARGLNAIIVIRTTLVRLSDFRALSRDRSARGKELDEPRASARL